MNRVFRTGCFFFARMLSIMVNECFGGFGLSDAAITEYRRRCAAQTVVVDGDLDDSARSAYEGIARHDPVMVQVVRDLGPAASAAYGDVRIREIPERFVAHYSISDYDGRETIIVHRNAFRVDAARTILRDGTLSKTDKLARLAAVLLHDDDAMQDGMVDG